MQTVLTEAKEFLQNSGFIWALCGGHGIDIFVGKVTRSHSDVDVSVYWEDKESVIKFMLESNWRVFEACGEGIVRELTYAEMGAEKHNLFCFTKGNDECFLRPIQNNYFNFSLGFNEQKVFNYVEFLFIDKDKFFVYPRGIGVGRHIEESTFGRDGFRCLSPEIILFYKAADYFQLIRQIPVDSDRIEKHLNDFRIAIPLMSNKQTKWLRDAIEYEFGKEHDWGRSYL